MERFTLFLLRCWGLMVWGWRNGQASSPGVPRVISDPYDALWTTRVARGNPVSLANGPLRLAGPEARTHNGSRILKGESEARMPAKKMSDAEVQAGLGKAKGWT